jgi:hypothetical protein
MIRESNLNHTEAPVDRVAGVEADERWPLVLHVAGSRHFRKAPRLHDILIYICRRVMAEPGAIIKEHEIGCNVLGRSPDFSSTEDNIVRVQVSHLRKKLDEYYATDGRDDAVWIAIPKGSYVPRFEPRPVPVASDGASTTQAAAVAAHAGSSGRWPSIRVAILLVSAGLAAGAMAMWLVERHSVPRNAVDPVLLEAWGPLAGEANVLLSAATPLHLVVGPAGHQAYGTSEYPAPQEAYSLFRKHRLLPPGAKLGMLFTENSLGVGTMNAVVAASTTLRSLGSTYQILPEHVATLSAIRGRNTILFGAPVDSEAISRTMEKTPLVVDYEPSVREFVIRDRTSGQMIVPRKDPNGDLIDVYGLITVLNTRESDRGRLGTVIFSGITSTGTQGAAEFFSSPRSLRELRGIFASEGVKGFPPAYQVVVTCTFSNMLLVAYQYHSHRILH